MKPTKIKICQYCSNKDYCYSISCVKCETKVPICEYCFIDIESTKYKPITKESHEFKLKLNSVKCKSCRRENLLKNILK